MDSSQHFIYHKSDLSFTQTEQSVVMNSISRKTLHILLKYYIRLGSCVSIMQQSE